MEVDKELNELKIKTYQIFREQVTHENTLYNQRVSWLLTLNSFLFGGSIYLFGAAIVQPDFQIFLFQVFLVFLICSTGLFASLICNALVTQSRTVLNYLRTEWNNEASVGKIQSLDGVDIKLPHPSGGEGTAQAAKYLRGAMLPKAMIAAWFMFIVMAMLLVHLR